MTRITPSLYPLEARVANITAPTFIKSWRVMSGVKGGSPVTLMLIMRDFEAIFLNQLLGIAYN
jgi:hypothetical protein